MPSLFAKLSLITASLLTALVTGCSDSPPGSINGIYDPPEFPTEFTLDVIGNGTVSMLNHGDCVGTGGKETITPCGTRRNAHGAMTVTAIPAANWHFDGWYDEFNSKTTGDSQKIEGSRVGHKVTAKFVPDLFKVSPIKAVFTPKAQMTTYTAEISNPHNEALTVSWVGPNCGDHNPKLPETKVWTGTTTMNWHHPHPACDASPAHASTRIGLVIAGAGGVVACHYNGAEDGVGPVCE